MCSIVFEWVVSWLLLRSVCLLLEVSGISIFSVLVTIVVVYWHVSLCIRWCISNFSCVFYPNFYHYFSVSSLIWVSSKIAAKCRFVIFLGPLSTQQSLIWMNVLFIVRVPEQKSSQHSQDANQIPHVDCQGRTCQSKLPKPRYLGLLLSVMLRFVIFHVSYIVAIAETQGLRSWHTGGIKNTLVKKTFSESQKSHISLSPLLSCFENLTDISKSWAICCYFCVVMFPGAY